MNDETGSDSAFQFEGTWQEFAPIAFTNLLLTIVTLGIYRFWATTRERQYLWSRSRFVDENLEWAGTGKELFIGFMLVAVVFLLPFFIISQVSQALVLRGEQALAGALTLLSFLAIFYLAGIARFRALRYRLSRTRWRGIRGGSNDQGFAFGLSYMWKNFVGYLALGLLIPWSMVSLWNERWSKMSFGPHQFSANADQGPVFARYLLFYLAPIVMFVGIGIATALIGTLGAGFETAGEELGSVGMAFVLSIVLFIFGFYFILGLIAVAFYAAFYREVVGATRWNTVGFSFTASTKQWIMLLLGDVALVVFTLGIGYIFLSYRHWKFFITHLEADGEILLDELTQSTTETSRHGEGLLDAFDMGAI